MPENVEVKQINRILFFKKVRALFFNGKLSQHQVDGMTAILREWETRKLTDLRMLAYMLATVYHETAATMYPIEEYGKGKGRPYGKPNSKGLIHYGRGFVQITWESNYERFCIADYPEKALELPTATLILFDGMLKGMFTGKKLSDYFNDKKEDWINARRIINGVNKGETLPDKAELIAGYAKKFLTTLA